MVAYSLLDFGRVREGQDRQAALNHTRDAAVRAEALGFKRIWVAEHHNMPAVATAATSIVIGYIAEATTTIRVGAGGVMMPNHVPYILAEQFGTLATLYPDRIDLGLGRAPGTDLPAIQAMRVHPRRAEIFPQDVLELQSYLGDVDPRSHVEAVPGSSTNIPLWILGSSLEGAKLAASEGLPYGFASHFAPQMLDAALNTYCADFQPSPDLTKPRIMACVNVIAAETDEEARHQFTSMQMSFTNLVSGQMALFQPPIQDIEAFWTPVQKAQVNSMLSCSFVGGPDKIKQELSTFLSRTGADELMIVSDLYEPSRRLRSLEIISDVMKDIQITMPAKSPETTS